MTPRSFHGGLRLPEFQAESIAQPVRTCRLPDEAVLPLAQYAGGSAQPRVCVGERVRTGQCIAEAPARFGAAVHASVTGTVVAIEDRRVPHASNLAAPCIVIRRERDDDWLHLPPLALDEHSDTATLLQRLHEAGVVGLGGATFPTAAKLARPVHTLIINGAECEPYIACDDMLLRERAADVIAGARLMQRICGARRVFIAVEDRMVAAHASLAAMDLSDIELVQVPTIYPQGGERQLILVVAGREVPSGGWPRDIGVVVQNVATAAAAHRAVAHGETLVSRLVTVTGRGVAAPCTLDVRLGTPIADVIAAAGGYTGHAARLIMGGPMMGIALGSDAIPIAKSSNCVLVLGERDVRARAPELPCIRCGECSRVCPAQLLPQQLLWHVRAGDWDAARDDALADCIECGCCAFVCPSQIPLVDWYRHGKSELRLLAFKQARADRARERYVARGERLARRERERADRLATRVPAPAPAATSAASGPLRAEPAEDPIQAALRRTKARKSAAAASEPAATNPPRDRDAPPP